MDTNLEREASLLADSMSRWLTQSEIRFLCLDALRRATAAERERCASLPCPPPRNPYTQDDCMEESEMRAYEQAWKDYAAAIQARKG
jgi:hypothetical protein